MIFYSLKGVGDFFYAWTRLEVVKLIVLSRKDSRNLINSKLIEGLMVNFAKLRLSHSSALKAKARLGNFTFRLDLPLD